MAYKKPLANVTGSWDCGHAVDWFIQYSSIAIKARFCLFCFGFILKVVNFLGIKWLQDQSEPIDVLFTYDRKEQIDIPVLCHINQEELALKLQVNLSCVSLIKIMSHLLISELMTSKMITNGTTCPTSGVLPMRHLG